MTIKICEKKMLLSTESTNFCYSVRGQFVGRESKAKKSECVYWNNWQKCVSVCISVYKKVVLSMNFDCNFVHSVL